MDRAGEFIQLFNRVEQSLSKLLNPKVPLPFGQLVDKASALSAAVRGNAGDLKQFAKLRNAIVHDPEFPTQIIAEPSQEALLRFTHVAQEILEPAHLIPTFEAKVRCFSASEKLCEVLKFMGEHDFSQVTVRGSDGRLRLLTVEGITMWLADNVGGEQNPTNKAVLDNVISHEPPGGFIIMNSSKTIFDAMDAFANSIHTEATRLYAIVITIQGSDMEEPIGVVTPWDLVHNPQLGRLNPA